MFNGLSSVVGITNIGLNVRPSVTMTDSAG